MIALIADLDNDIYERVEEEQDKRGIELGVSLFGKYRDKSPIVITSPSAESIRFPCSAVFSIVYLSPITGRMALSFSSYGRHFPGEGRWAWLTKDKSAQEKYENDILCGFTCSSSFYIDLLTGIEIANDRKLNAQIRKDLPMLIISGEEDPVGNYGKGVRKVFNMYRDLGLENVLLRLFKSDRHEILNETDKDDVMKEIGRFCLDVMDKLDE